MKFFFILYALCLYSLAASINEPLRIEYFSGYRNDRIHWHLQNNANATIYSETYKDVEFWENGLSFKSIHRDFLFLIRGSYSAFGKGRFFETYQQLGFSSEPISFRGRTSGWGADVSGYVSYAANLTNGRLYKWILFPILGYSAHFERLNRSSPKAQIGSSYEMISTLPEELRQSWYGPFLGVALQIEPGGRLIFNVGYTYHWLRTQLKTRWQDQVLLFNGASVASSSTTTNSLYFNRGGNLGQTGWGQVDYCLSRAWRIGLGAQIHYFSTKFHSVTIKQNQIAVSETFKLRWTPIDGWLQISREF